MILAAILLQATAPQLPPPLIEAPSAEAVALGRRLAAAGTLSALLPLMIEKDLAELSAEPKAASAIDRAAIVASGRRVAAARTAQLMDATGRAYARYLSVADLRTLVAAAESPAGARRRIADPAVIMATIQAVGGIDLKKEVAAAVCAERKLLCDR